MFLPRSGEYLLYPKYRPVQIKKPEYPENDREKSGKAVRRRLECGETAVFASKKLKYGHTV